MSGAVTLLHNASSHVSSHVWHATGVEQLTRRNKLSSLPFFVPNDVMRTHRFRLVLMRALDAADDAIGLVVEWLPPLHTHDDDGSNNNSDTTRAAGVTASSPSPGGCSVTVRVTAPHYKNDKNNNNSKDDNDDAMNVTTTDDVDELACQTEVDELSGENTQVCFAQLVSVRDVHTRHAALLASLSSTTAAAARPSLTLTLHVTITTHVNVLVEHVSRTVTSLWSSLTQSVTQLMQQQPVVSTLRAATHERSECADTDNNKSTLTTAEAAAHATMAAATTTAARTQACLDHAHEAARLLGEHLDTCASLSTTTSAAAAARGDARGHDADTELLVDAAVRSCREHVQQLEMLLSQQQQRQQHDDDDDTTSRLVDALTQLRDALARHRRYEQQQQQQQQHDDKEDKMQTKEQRDTTTASAVVERVHDASDAVAATRPLHNAPTERVRGDDDDDHSAHVDTDGIDDVKMPWEEEDEDDDHNEAKQL